MTSILSFRLYKKLKQSEVAKKLGLSFKEYQLLEAGRLIVEAETMEKLSELYQAPAEIFSHESSPLQISFIYSNNTFTNSNGYVNHLYQETDKAIEIIKDANRKEILLLQKEIRKLRNENDELIKKLTARKK